MKTLHIAFDEYLEKKQGKLKEYSFQGYNQSIKKLKEEFADLPLEQITTEEVQDYVDDWSKIYSKNTIKKKITILKEVLKLNGIYIDKLEIKQNKPKKIKVYTAEEINKLETYLFKKCKTNHLSLPIAIYTGLRMGEILALQWLDIDLNRKLISVSKNCVYIHHKGMILQDPKTQSSNREIPIPEQLYEILKKHEPKSDDDWEKFVVGGKTQPLLPRTQARTAELICLKAGVEWKGFHAFRHSYATRMLESNIPAKAVSDLLGHSNITTTLNIYSHTTNDFKKECVLKAFEDINYKKEKEKQELNKQIYMMQEMLSTLIKKVESL